MSGSATPRSMSCWSTARTCGASSRSTGSWSTPRASGGRSLPRAERRRASARPGRHLASEQAADGGAARLLRAWPPDDTLGKGAEVLGDLLGREEVDHGAALVGGPHEVEP